MVTTLKDLKDLHAESGWALPWAQGRTARARLGRAKDPRPSADGPAGPARRPGRGEAERAELEWKTRGF